MRISLFLTLWLCLLIEYRAQANILVGAGIGGFDVAIERLDPEARSAKLNEASLRKVIISRMQRRGAKLRTGADAQLYARVVVLTSRDVNNKVLGYGAHVELSFREKVFVKRQPKTFFMAPTWYKGAVAVANPGRITSEVVSNLAALTDRFLADYKAANPVFGK